MIDKAKAAARAARWRAKNPDKVRIIQRRAREKALLNPDKAAKIREFQSGYREKNREYLSGKERERRFGISLADYSVLVAAQDNKCAICFQPETEMRNGKVKALAVDHDHETGENRGLLCVACNTGIGKLKEDRNIMISAIKYLDKYSEARPNVVPLVSKGNK